MYFVAQPISAINQIQNTAPGPPRAIATGTPTMLEAPMEDAKAAAEGYEQTTAKVEEFNNKMKENFSDIYIDVYSRAGPIFHRCGYQFSFTQA